MSRRDGYEPVRRSGESPYSAEEEMEMAFESDDEDQDTVPLAQQIPHQPPSVHTTSQVQGGAYDFERDYDRPPPGSPPAPSASIALGNSNGIIPVPSSTSRPIPLSQKTRLSFFRRTVGALLPQYYTRVPTHETEVVGSGIENDGVFSNVSARPSAPRTVRDENGDVHVMPEDVQDEAPPSYATAQADAAPPYWETTVHAPAFGGADDLLIEGLSAGSIFSFAWNFLISVSFQFVGFMLTYLLHTSHAAKYGSRAGLGVTLIQYGLFSRSAASETDLFGDGSDSEVGATTFPTQTPRLKRRDYVSLSSRFWSTSSEDGSDRVVVVSNGTVHDWIAFLLMTVGWILLLSSLFGFLRVKRWERSIRTPTPAPTTIVTPETMRREAEIRSRLAEAFGLDIMPREEIDDQSHETPIANDSPDQNPNAAAIAAHEERMRRYLTATGLI